MKSFGYYKQTNLPYFGRFDSDYGKKLIKEINDSSMTSQERIDALNGVDVKVRDYCKELNKPYNDAKDRLEAEFWKDAREDLGYTDFLNEVGVSTLESKAWEDGHAYGFHDVYLHLSELTDFARKIIG